MRYIIVTIWGIELGRLSYNPRLRQCYFTFNPELKQNRPDISPLLLPLEKWQNHQIAYGDDRRIYQNLPPFIADSLPDSWGNKLFEQWAKKNKLTQRNITPLYKLMFIGRRGMGALEFEPADKDLEHSQSVDIKALHELSLKILNDREDISILPDEELTMHTLLSVGTSAGGRQTKAIIAIHKETGEIRSGQITGLPDYDYFLLKFEDEFLPTSEIEMAYYEMATSAGIEMEECKLLDIGGMKHFLTRRFDRKNGEKIHMQTLAAINPDATSYEDMFATCRLLNLPDAEIEQIFRRLVFNVMGNNTDDHNKNFSFILEKGCPWKLSPAYDVTFIFNRYGTDAETDRCLSIAGKYRDITKADLIEIGKENGIRNPERIIDEIAKSLKKFSSLAEKYSINPRWGNIIKKTLDQRLSEFGYLHLPEHDQILKDSSGRIFSNIVVSMNAKGHYVVTLNIDGIHHRRFIRPKMDLYETFQKNQFSEGPAELKISILETLFPIENKSLNK